MSLPTLTRLAVVLALVIGAADLGVTAWLVTIAASQKHQTCTLFIDRYKADLDQLSQTRDYLAHLSRTDRRLALNRRVAANLPQLVQRARSEKPPAYCGYKKR